MRYMSYIVSVKPLNYKQMTNKKNQNNQIAATILTQLGGNKFVAMTGSKNFVAGENLLGMKLPRNNSGANYLRITLNSLDLYLMEFLSIRGVSIKTKATFENVYSDKLQENFTSATGLNTSL